MNSGTHTFDSAVCAFSGVERLKELDDLKQDGLVTDKEYKAKKQDILKGL